MRGCGAVNEAAVGGDQRHAQAQGEREIEAILHRVSQRERQIERGRQVRLVGLEGDDAIGERREPRRTRRPRLLLVEIALPRPSAENGGGASPPPSPRSCAP